MEKLRIKPLFVSLMALFTLTTGMVAQSSPCNQPAASPAVRLALPAPPFTAVPSADGCWVFVSMVGGRGGQPGIAVVKRSGGTLTLEHTVAVTPTPTGIVLTHDGQLLIAAAGSATVFLDTKKLMVGDANAVLGSIGGGRGAIYVNVTPDDKTLFVSQENGGTITVIDLDRARRRGFNDAAVIGQIPAGEAPIALTFSPRAKYLYTTSELALPDWQWPNACKPEGSAVPDTVLAEPEGAVEVIDVAKARTDPAHAVVARVPAGCSAVRMAMSPNGDRIYVTARNSNALVAFDTAKLISDPAHAQVAMAPTGDAPVPLAVVNQGREVIAGNSNRFAGANAPQQLVVLNAARFNQGAGAVLGTIAAGAFPREMRVSADQRTLFLTDFGSSALQMFDLSRLPIEAHVPADVAANAKALAERSQRKAIVLSPSLLAAYAGAYQSPNDHRIYVISVAGDHLFLNDSPPAMPEALFAVSPSDFYLASGPKITFPKTAPGQPRVDHLDIQLPPQRARNLGLAEHSRAQRLDDAVGNPYADEAAQFQQRFKNKIPAPGSEAAAHTSMAELQSGQANAGLFAVPGKLRQGLVGLKSAAAMAGAVQSLQFDSVGRAGPDIYLAKSANGTWALSLWLLPNGKLDDATLIMVAPPAAEIALASGCVAAARRSSGPSSRSTPPAVLGEAAAADLRTAAEDTSSAGLASGYVEQLAAAGGVGATRAAASCEAMMAETAAAATETAAAAVESDVVRATAASAAGDKAAAQQARDRANSDYSTFLAANGQLAKAAAALTAAAKENTVFFAANVGAAAINDIGTQDASAAGNLLAAATGGGPAQLSAAAANETKAAANARTLAGLVVPPRAKSFQAVAQAEAAAQLAAQAAAGGASPAAAAAAAVVAAHAMAAADGPGNPFAGAVETGAGAVGNAAAATISVREAMGRLRSLP